MKKLGIKENRPTNLNLNHDIFENIDTEQKAYWLGMLYADGYIKTRKNINSIQICLGLKILDSYHVEKFSKFVESSLPLKTRSTKLGTDQAMVAVSSVKMGKDLIRHGCVPRKSLILKPPTKTTLPDNLNRHFIRGFFDGDGCICITKEKFCSVMFYSTYNIVLWIQQTMKNELNIPENKIQKDGNIFKCYYTNLEHIKLIEEYLYKDCTVKLNRKYELFQKHNNHREQILISLSEQINNYSDKKLISLGRQRLGSFGFSKEERNLIYGTFKDRINCYTNTHSEYVKLLRMSREEIEIIINNCKGEKLLTNCRNNIR